MRMNTLGGFLRTSNGRFLVRLLAAEILASAALIPWFSIGGDLPWDAYFAFGLVWWSFIVAIAARWVYRAGRNFTGAVRWGLWLAGSAGLVIGGFFSLGESVIVSGFPPIVLPFTPMMMFTSTGAGLALGLGIGNTFEWIWRRAEAAARR